MKARPDYSLVLVLHFGFIAAFAAGTAYARWTTQAGHSWMREFVVIAVMALIVQTAVTLLLAREAPRRRTRLTGYVLSALSFAGIFLLPLLLRAG